VVCWGWGRKTDSKKAGNVLVVEVACFLVEVITNQHLIRLVAHAGWSDALQDNFPHGRWGTDCPFCLKGWKPERSGVHYSTTTGARDCMRVRAVSNRTMEYQTTFIVHIAVSAYPYWAAVQDLLPYLNHSQAKSVPSRLLSWTAAALAIWKCCYMLCFVCLPRYC
jgi:hypothetical protein